MKKRFLAIMIILSFLLSAIDPSLISKVSATPDNILANADFETGAFSPWTYRDPQFSISTEQAHSGTYSVKLVNGNTWGYLGQTVSVRPNTDYVWTLWMKSSGYNGAQMRILRAAADGGGILPGTSAVNNASSSLWKKYTINFNSGSYSQLVLSVSDSASNKTHYIDDMSLYVANPSHNAKLSALVYQPDGSSAASVPGFSATDEGGIYNVILPEGTTSVTVGATKADPYATMTLDPADGVVNMINHAGTSTVTITAEDGDATNVFVINFIVPANLFENPGFETGTLSGWTVPAQFAVTTEKKLSGTYSLKKTGISGSWAFAYQDISVTPNTDYNANFYYRANNSGTAIKIVNTSNALIYDNGSTSNTNNQWRQCSFGFNSGNNSVIRFILQDSWGGTHYFDDFDLRPAGMPTPQPPPTPTPTPAPITSWNFDSGTEGWTFYGSANTTVSADGGILTSTYKNGSSSAAIQSADNLKIDLTNHKVIKIRMRNNTDSTAGHIFWSTTAEGSTTYAVDRMVEFAIAPNSGYTDYEIDMSDQPLWAGTLKRLRIDPSFDGVVRSGQTVKFENISVFRPVTQNCQGWNIR